MNVDRMIFDRMLFGQTTPTIYYDRLIILIFIKTYFFVVRRSVSNQFLRILAKLERVCKVKKHDEFFEALILIFIFKIRFLAEKLRFSVFHLAMFVVNYFFSFMTRFSLPVITSKSTKT